MRVVITGGGGFLGHQLCEALIRVGSLLGGDSQAYPIERIVLLDSFFTREPPRVPESSGGMEILKVVGSIESQDAIDQAMGMIRPESSENVVVFHLASMVSGECEERFDDAIRVNLQGGLKLLESARRIGPACRFVFASSIACFGGPAMQDPCTDWTKLTPQTTYGMTKTIGELLVCDYTRKGFLDGRSVRLPTVIIRPGKPNTAASSWASGMFREPLSGIDCLLPVHLEQRHPMTSYRTVIDSLVAICNLPSQQIGKDRSIGLPAMSITPAMAQRALVQAVGGNHGIVLPSKLGQIVLSPDRRIQGIVDQWPVAIDATRALGLGLPNPPNLIEIIRNFVDDFMSDVRR